MEEMKIIIMTKRVETVGQEISTKRCKIMLRIGARIDSKIDQTIDLEITAEINSNKDNKGNDKCITKS